MKYVIYLFTIVFLLSLNLGFFPFFQIQGVAPNLLLILVVLSALSKSGYDFFFIALVSGIFLDCFSGIFFGTFSVAFLVLSYLLHVLIQRVVVYEINWKYQIALLVFSIIMVNILVWFYNILAFKLGWVNFSVDFSLIRRRFLPELFYNLLLFFPMFVFVGAIKNFIAKLEFRSRKVI